MGRYYDINNNKNIDEVVAMSYNQSGCQLVVYGDIQTQHKNEGVGCDERYGFFRRWCD